MQMKAMTFNLRLNVASDGENAWPHRADLVVKTIQENDPHIFGIQEGLYEMVQKLQTSLPAYQKIGEGRGGGEKDEYSAIFYKKDFFTIEETGQFWLSETPDVPNSMSWESACPRICTWGEFTLKEDPTKRLLFLNTHLDHVSQEAREKGTTLICEHANPYLEKEIPVVVTGDLNVTPENKVIQLLEEANLMRLPTEGKTFHGFKGGKTGEPIDYIFISKNIQWEEITVDRRTEEGKYPSDHYPVVATLHL